MDIAYTDTGSGPATVFVHGVFTNGLLWRHCVRLLAGERRCITIDLPGHGRTPPTGEPTVFGLAAAVRSVLDELDLHDVHLVGNDTGGAVAQAVLAAEPERFASFALTNCDTEGNFPPPLFRPAVWAARSGLLALGRPLAGRPALARQVYRTGYQNAAAVPDEIITAYVRPILGTRDGLRFMRALLSSMSPTTLAPIHPQLSACHVPTAVIWGTGDLFFHRRWADWLVALIPGATSVVEIPGARLFFPDERAPELVAALRNHWR